MTFVVNTSHAVLVVAVLALAGTASAQTGHMLRFNTNGQLDGQFGSGGEVVLSVPGATSAVVNDVLIQSNDKIVIVGSAVVSGVSCFMVGRRNANGTPDMTFSGDGFAFVHQASVGEAKAVAFMSNKIVAAGWRTAPTGETTLLVARFASATGAPDATFGTNGVAEVVYPGAHAVASAVEITPLTQSILIGGSMMDFFGLESDFMAVRLNSNGSLNGSFGTNGTRIIELPESSYAQGFDMDVYMGKTDALGHLAVGGTVTLANGQERCAAAVIDVGTGTYVNTFDTDGRKVLEMPYGTQQHCETIDLVSGGQVTLGGRAWSNASDSRFALARLTWGGAPETGFSTDGYLFIDFPGFDDESIKDIHTNTSATGLVVVGSAFVTGGVDEVLAIAHISGTGVPTAGFGSGGRVTFNAPSYTINVGNGVALEADGQAVAVGQLQ